MRVRRRIANIEVLPVLPVLLVWQQMRSVGLVLAKSTGSDQPAALKAFAVTPLDLPVCH